jgi:hypothetical protein
MTVILVLATFVAFLLIDHFFSKKTVMVAAEARPVSARPSMPLDASLVNGFKVPENLRYHPGHTWADSGCARVRRSGACSATA